MVKRKGASQSNKKDHNSSTSIPNKLKDKEPIKLKSRKIVETSVEALQAHGGAFFYHEHGHIGSLEILTELMPIFKQEKVKYFFVEQPIDKFSEIFKAMNNEKNISKLKVTIPFSEQNKPYIKALFELYEAAIVNDIAIIPVDVPVDMDSTRRAIRDPKYGFKHLLNRVTSLEAQILNNINCHLNEKSIGLFGKSHIGLAVQKNFPVIVLQDSGVKQTWQAQIQSNITVENLVFQYSNFKEKNDENAKQFLQIMEKLPEFISATFSLPSQKPRSCLFNRYNYFAAAGLVTIAAAGLVAWSKMWIANDYTENIFETLANMTTQLKM